MELTKSELILTMNALSAHLDIVDKRCPEEKALLDQITQLWTRLALEFQELDHD